VPSTWIPNSVSVPMIRRTVMLAAYGERRNRR
jgi:hypothetical protein